MTDAKHEAPAEGAGEDDWSELDRLADAATQGPWKVCGTIYEHMNCEVRGGAKGEGQAIAQVWDGPNAFKDGQFIAAANPATIKRLIAALRARSSAPEAREEALGNLLAVIHGDGGHRALEVGTKQAALEAEKIVVNLMNDQSKSLLGGASVDPDKVETVSHVDAMPQAAQDGGLGTQAREEEALEQTARQLAFVHAYHSARKNCSNPNAKHETWTALANKQSERDWKRFLPDAKLMQQHTHPAAPSADKLRIAVEALERAKDNADTDEVYVLAMDALAALEAEGAK